jgi:hypothetical protein
MDMNKGLLSLLSGMVITFLAAPATAWADANPDFDDDAVPILRIQPNLVEYVKSHFEVKDTGMAKFPGDDDHRPTPPYIFRARPRGSNGPYNFRLLIQPGPPGHILGIVDMTKINQPAPTPPPGYGAPAPAPQQQPPPATVDQPAPQSQPPPQSLQPVPPEPQPPVSSPAPSPAPQPSAPTSDTPSGPITGSGQPSLAPPPDPAPSAQ